MFPGCSVAPVSGMTGEPAVMTARPRNYRLVAALFARRRIVSARLDNIAGLVAVAAAQADGFVLTRLRPAAHSRRWPVAAAQAGGFVLTIHTPASAISRAWCWWRKPTIARRPGGWRAASWR